MHSPVERDQESGTDAGQIGLPSGTVTFLFTDIEASTQHFHRLGERYQEELALHNRVVGAAIERHGGVVVKTEGDSFFAAFDSAAAAVAASVEAQRELAKVDWPGGEPLRVRMGLHRGQAMPVDGDYVALAVHQAARVSAAAHGDQILVSSAIAASAAGHGWHFDRLGEYRLRGFDVPVLLHQVAGEGLRADFPAVRAPAIVNHNLPPLPRSFVGRETAVTEAVRLVASHRAITLVGPGGVGKTSLAVAVAERAASRFPGGAWWVDLTTVKEDELVAEAIAEALGVLGAGGRALAVVEERLIVEPTMLLLDNCEHLADAVSVVIDGLADRCPDLTVVVTSRVPVRHRREKVVEVTPLEDEHAVELLTHQAGRSDAGPAATGDSITLVEITRLLDGLPLALELVGALLAENEPHAVLERLRATESEGTGSLAPGLQASLAWSYELLDEDTAECFRRLAVFAGACTLEAAGAVCSDDSRSAGRVVELILDLADRSLVQLRAAGGRRRVHLLESVRTFAAEQRRLEGLDQAEERHVEWFRTLAEGSAHVLDRGPTRLQTAHRLLVDLEDLRLAGRRAAARADAHTSLRVGLIAGGAASAVGRDLEARLCLVEALESAAPASAELPRAWIELSHVMNRLGEYDECERLISLALEAAQRDGLAVEEAQAALDWASLQCLRNRLDRAEELLEATWEKAQLTSDTAIDALSLKATIAERRGNFAAAAASNETALALSRSLGDPSYMARALNNLAQNYTLMEDFTRAELLLREAAQLTSPGDEGGDAHVLGNLAYHAFRRGELGEARGLANRAAMVARRQGMALGITFALNNLAEVELAAGDLEAARAYYREALQLAGRLSEADRIGYCLEGLGAILLAQRDPRRAVLLLASADRHRTATGAALPDVYEASNEALLVEARELLGPQDFQVAWRAGRELELQEAMELALADDHHGEGR